METSPEAVIHFEHFRLEPQQRRLWRGEQEVELRPTALAVLRHLALHPGRVVTRKELLEAVWAGTQVAESAVKVCVWEIRRALGDTAATARFIETVGWRG